jgi:hypothetical protein
MNGVLFPDELPLGNQRFTVFCQWMDGLWIRREAGGSGMFFFDFATKDETSRNMPFFGCGFLKYKIMFYESQSL